jgi:protein TonB
MIELLTGDEPARRGLRARVSGAAVGSTLLHAIALLAFVWLVRQRVEPRIEVVRPDTQRVVWIATPGPGGGGGGNPVTTPPPLRPAPPKATRTEAPPAPAPVSVPPEITPVTPQPQEPQPPAPAAIADASTAGATTAPPVTGGGTGTGSGPGNGIGSGRGDEKGFGGGAYQAGNGVSTPVPIRRATPQYTVEAMRARAQGIITVECVVEPDGECGDVRIVRSFMPPYGLDQQALATARRWRFRPGTRAGEAVPVLVNLEIEFNIR